LVGELHYLASPIGKAFIHPTASVSVAAPGASRLAGWVVLVSRVSLLVHVSFALPKLSIVYLF
jgi:hypothetical protein